MWVYISYRNHKLYFFTVDWKNKLVDGENHQ